MRNKKTISVLSILLIIVLMLGGCRGNVLNINTESQAMEESETETTSQTDVENELTETRDVVFLNYDVKSWGLDAVISQEMLLNLYEFTEDENTLYAFRLEPVCSSSNHEYCEDYPIQGATEDDKTYAERKKEYFFNLHKELLLAEGLFIVDNCSDKYLVVAGTKSVLERVFNEMNGRVGKYCDFNAFSVTRPDSFDVLEETGYTQEEIDEYFEKTPKKTPFLGTDANQVTLTVPVIVPDEVPETK